MDRYKVVPGDFHNSQVIRAGVTFIRSLIGDFIQKFSLISSSKIVLYPMKIGLKIFIPPQNIGKSWIPLPKILRPWYPELEMTPPLHRNRGTLGAHAPPIFATDKEVPFSFLEKGPLFFWKKCPRCVVTPCLICL